MMTLTQEANYDGTVRKVWDDRKAKCLGVIGTVRDLVALDLIKVEDGHEDTWAFMSTPSDDGHVDVWFAESRKELLIKIVNGRKEND